MITIDVQSSSVLEALERLVRRTEDLRPALMEIGEEVAESTRRRFVSSTSPDGVPWAPNTAVTVARYLGVFGGSFKKDGSLSKRGAARAGGKKPLVGETRDLSTTISWQLDGDGAVVVGSNRPYAAMQQFGGTKSQWPHLWGDIPARPYLGLSADDELTIQGIVVSYLQPYS